MRIIGGKHRGRVLTEFKGEAIRPTADRVKESVFNILSREIAGARVLDLFCGSGAQVSQVPVYYAQTAEETAPARGFWKRIFGG